MIDPSAPLATTNPLITKESLVDPPKILETLTYSTSNPVLLLGRALMQASETKSVKNLS